MAITACLVCALGHVEHSDGLNARGDLVTASTVPPLQRDDAILWLNTSNNE